MGQPKNGVIKIQRLSMFVEKKDGHTTYLGICPGNSNSKVIG
jgi:hypothetical protein